MTLNIYISQNDNRIECDPSQFPALTILNVYVNCKLEY